MRRRRNCRRASFRKRNGPLPGKREPGNAKSQYECFRTPNNTGDHESLCSQRKKMGNSEKSQFSSTSPPGFPLNPTNQKSNDFHQRPREPSKSNFEGLTPQGSPASQLSDRPLAAIG